MCSLSVSSVKLRTSLAAYSPHRVMSVFIYCKYPLVEKRHFPINQKTFDCSEKCHIWPQRGKPCHGYDSICWSELLVHISVACALFLVFVRVFNGSVCVLYRTILFYVGCIHLYPHPNSWCDHFQTFPAMGWFGNLIKASTLIFSSVAIKFSIAPFFCLPFPSI